MPLLPAGRCLAACFALVVWLAGGGALRAADLAALIAQRERWPAEVTVTKAARATVLEAGQPRGAMLLGAGRTLAVIDLQADGLVGRIGGVAVKVAVDKTDLWVRVGERRMPEAAAAAPAAAGKTESTVTTSPEGNGAASAASASTRRVPPAMQRLLADKLVRLEGGRVKSAGAAAVEGVRFFALYYSASWCGPCRQFTPDLIRAYRELKAKHPEFEVVFVSADRSAGEMADYMKGDKMPWLAVGYEKRDHKIMSYSGPGIPCLVLVDEQGRVLSDSYEGDNYVGPQKVLADTRRRLARND